MKKTLLAACIAAVTLALTTTGCLVGEERGHGHGHAHFESHSEVIVEHPVVIAPPRPVLVVRPPEVIIR